MANEELERLQAQAGGILELVKGASGYEERRALNRRYDSIQERILALKQDKVDRVSPLLERILKLSQQDQMMILCELMDSLPEGLKDDRYIGR